MTDNCAGCELPIHVKNLVFDGEKNWHYKCFSCNQCNSGLVNQKYYDKEGTLLCNNCYLAQYLPTCFYCNKEIKGRSEYSTVSIYTSMVLSRTIYTSHTVNYTTCKVSLILVCTSLKYDMIYGISDGVKMSAVSGQVLTWHEDCLECSVCKEGVTLDNVVFKDNLFCKTCYLETMLNKCDTCKQVSGGIINSFYFSLNTSEHHWARLHLQGEVLA